MKLFHPNFFRNTGAQEQSDHSITSFFSCHSEALAEGSTKQDVLTSSPLRSKGRLRGVENINPTSTPNIRHPEFTLSRPVILREQSDRRIHCGRSFKSGFFTFAQNDGRTKDQNDVRMIQSGRSLTEMLGTLAIMAVLSIGAIAGFNYAMNKHRANELLDEARKRAYTVMTQIQLGLTQSLGEYSRYNTFAGGTFGSEIVTEGLTGRFGLKVIGVKKAVCQNLVDSIGISTPLRWVATGSKPSVEIESCADEGDYILVYNNSLTAESAKPCKTDSDCGECGTCNTQGGVCHYPERDTKRCPTATPYCDNGQCEPCPSGQFRDSYNACRSCDSSASRFWVGTDDFGAQQCHRCSGTRISSAWGDCTRCDSTIKLTNTDRAECFTCPNRFMWGTGAAGTCQYCEGKLLHNRMLCDWECYNNDEPAIPYNGKCTPCSEVAHLQTIPLGEADFVSAIRDDTLLEKMNNACEKCGRIFNQTWGTYGLCAKKCTGDGEFLDADGQCRKCGQKFHVGWLANITRGYPYNRVEELKEQCLSCEGMIYDADNIYCYLCADSKEKIDCRVAEYCDRCKGVRYYDGRYCIRCPARDTDAWNTLTAAQKGQCTAE